ncbi:MAG TPA: sugar phosphate isomerase/epimerase [Armatimonadetes bacterium]|nr:sugar phosphate isomerase/epimerase [Armatimonadota bacterium]
MKPISLAGWSLNRRFRRVENPLQLADFPRVAREEFGIMAIELNEPFFPSTEEAYLKELVRIAEGEGVKMLNIAIDRQGNLSAPDPTERRRAVENHRRWFEVAATLGCNAIRANTGGHGEPVTEDLLQRCSESFAALAEAGEQAGIYILIENHGGISAYPDNILRILREVDNPWLGTLPDFGNFPPEVDRYAALEKIAPYARAVHAKMFEFDERGEETTIDIGRCVRILQEAGYTGHFGIEFEGPGGDHEGVLKAKALLERYL